MPRDSSDSAQEALHEFHRRSYARKLKGEIPLPPQLGGTEEHPTAQAGRVPGLRETLGQGLPVTSPDAERSSRPRSPVPRPRSPAAAPQLSVTQNGARSQRHFIACGGILKADILRTQAGTPRTHSGARSSRRGGRFTGSLPQMRPWRNGGQGGTGTV